jgi:hypothetical protein
LNWVLELGASTGFSNWELEFMFLNWELEFMFLNWELELGSRTGSLNWVLELGA